MNGTILRETLQAILPASLIMQAAEELGVVERERKLEIVKLVYSLVLSAGSEDSGALAEALKRYRDEAKEKVVRGAFYAWLDDEMADLMEFLVAMALDYISTLPTFLPGILGTVNDWLIYDSETVTLRPALANIYPGSGSDAAVKVHKELSVGRGCMTRYHFSPAKDHDAGHFEVGEWYRGKGLLVDLGYASLKFLRDCLQYNVAFVIRLKENWKPTVERIFRGEIQGEFFAGTDFDELLMDEVIVMNGRCVDAEVTIGKGKNAVTCRLVMIPGPKGYLIYLTNLPRGTHGPHKVGDLYRVRYEIELDNKLDKSAAQLDQIRSTTDSSVRIQLCAKLLHSLIVDVLAHRDNLDRVRNGYICRGPLHRLMLAYALRSRHALLVAALVACYTPQERWNQLAEPIAQDGRDPNWRNRPSVLDRLLGLTAPRGRPRKKKLRDCRPSAAPYRRAEQQTATL
jgi:putative transposase